MKDFLAVAIKEAEQSLQDGGIPIGSVLVHKNKVIGTGHNRRIQNGSSILHGEMDALENAGRLNADVYKECILFTTLSPCSMCSGAMMLYKIPQVVIGENINFKGEEDLLRARGIKVDVLQDKYCIEMMRSFISKNPELWDEDIGE